jgi:hypothetical protein
MNYQFEFELINGRRHYTAHCTAPNEEYARSAIQCSYMGFTVGKLVSTGPAHRFYAETDASDMTQEDYDYQQRTIVEYERMVTTGAYNGA